MADQLFNQPYALGFRVSSAINTSPSTALDQIGSTRGSLLYRSSTAWSIRTPSTTARYPLVSNGTGADPTYSGLIRTQNTGLSVEDTDASHVLTFRPGSNLTADRTLTVTTGDADRTLTLSTNVTLDQNLSTSSTPSFAAQILSAGAAEYRGNTVGTASQPWVGPDSQGGLALNTPTGEQILFTINNMQAAVLTSTGTFAVNASTTTAATFRIPHGTAPTSPTNGDIWSTTAGLFVRVNGVTRSVNLT